ncbi:MAG: hypothetical protein JW874_07285 [Spirochaetales bacterium]|nr:hypothetical protein [Spirochaetales bacterium]
MKKTFLIVFLILAVSGVFADEKPFRIYFTLSPALGHYHYWVVLGGVHGAEWEGGLNLLSVNFEYKTFDTVNLFAFLEATGHLYEDHEDSDFWLTEIWGLPHFKIGAGASLGRDFSRVRLSACGGIYYMLYIDGWDSSFSGIGVKAQLNAFFHFTDRFFMGLSGNLNDAFFPGDGFRYPFEILEYGAGLSGGFTF